MKIYLWVLIFIAIAILLYFISKRQNNNVDSIQDEPSSDLSKPEKQLIFS